MLLHCCACCRRSCKHVDAAPLSASHHKIMSPSVRQVGRKEKSGSTSRSRCSQDSMRSASHLATLPVFGSAHVSSGPTLPPPFSSLPLKRTRLQPRPPCCLLSTGAADSSHRSRVMEWKNKERELELITTVTCLILRRPDEALLAGNLCFVVGVFHSFAKVRAEVG